MADNPAKKLPDDTAYFLGGPSACAIVFDREYIEPVIGLLCEKTGDDSEDYTATDCSRDDVLGTMLLAEALGEETAATPSPIMDMTAEMIDDTLAAHPGCEAVLLHFLVSASGPIGAGTEDIREYVLNSFPALRTTDKQEVNTNEKLH